MQRQTWKQWSEVWRWGWLYAHDFGDADRYHQRWLPSTAAVDRGITFFDTVKSTALSPTKNSLVRRWSRSRDRW
jgi:hypothetical protein